MVVFWCKKWRTIPRRFHILTVGWFSADSTMASSGDDRNSVSACHLRKVRQSHPCEGPSIRFITCTYKNGKTTEPNPENQVHWSKIGSLRRYNPRAFVKKQRSCGRHDDHPLVLSMMTRACQARHTACLGSMWPLSLKVLPSNLTWRSLGKPWNSNWKDHLSVSRSWGKNDFCHLSPKNGVETIQLDVHFLALKRVPAANYSWDLPMMCVARFYEMCWFPSISRWLVVSAKRIGFRWFFNTLDHVNVEDTLWQCVTHLCNALFSKYIDFSFLKPERVRKMNAIQNKYVFQNSWAQNSRSFLCCLKYIRHYVPRMYS